MGQEEGPGCQTGQAHRHCDSSPTTRAWLQVRTGQDQTRCAGSSPAPCQQPRLPGGPGLEGEAKVTVQVGERQQDRTVRVRAHARTTKALGMENRMIPLAPQESLTQIYRLLPYRTPRYKAGQLTSTHRHVSPGYTLSSSISHERVHSSATVLPCWCPFLCYFLRPEPDQGSLARPF